MPQPEIPNQLSDLERIHPRQTLAQKPTFPTECFTATILLYATAVVAIYFDTKAWEMKLQFEFSKAV